MKLAIVGSVKVSEDQLKFAKAAIQGILMFYTPKLVISGGAEGIDTLAEEEADLFNFPKKIILPVNKQWEPNGYKIRNIAIAQECTHLLCIRTHQSTTYGSGWTADCAETLRKTVWRVMV